VMSDTSKARHLRTQSTDAERKLWACLRNRQLAGVPEVFDGGVKKAPASEMDVTALHAKIGQLTLENDFLEGALSKTGLLPSARR